VQSPYFDVVNLIERLHRQFLDLLKVELERRNIQDINNVQSLILYNIGDEEITVGELTARGFYLGSNVSYNLKKMVENEYLVQERSVHDRRSIRVRLSDKGHDLRRTLGELFEGQIETLPNSGFDEERLKRMVEDLRRLERFWQARHGFATAPFANVAAG